MATRQEKWEKEHPVPLESLWEFVKGEDIEVGFKDVEDKIKILQQIPEDERKKKDYYDTLSTITKYEQGLKKSPEIIGHGTPSGMDLIPGLERAKLLDEMDRLYPDRRKDDLPSKEGAVHKGERLDRLNIRRALQEGTEKKAARDIAEAKALAEAEAGTLKGRLKAAWNDADTRDAILGGIQESLTAPKYGKDVYGSRMADVPTNIRANLKMAEATKIARNKAQVDAMKVMAETNKLLDPRQYLSNAQKEADSYVQAQIRAGKILASDYDSAYARMLKQIAVKDLTSAKSGSIKDLYTYMLALEATDPVTANIFKEAIRSNAMYLAGDGTEFGAQTDAANEIIVKEKVTTN